MKIIKRFFRWVKKPERRIRRLFVLSLVLLNLYILAAMPTVPFKVTCSGPDYRVFNGSLGDGYTYILRRVLFRSDDSYTYWTNRSKRVHQRDPESETPVVWETNVLIPLYQWFDLENQHQYSMRAAIDTVQEEYDVENYFKNEGGFIVTNLEHLSNTLHGYRNGKLSCDALFFIAAEGRAPTAEEASGFSATD